MKNYSLKINGNKYDVSIDNVNELSTQAHVVVNGTAYEVEIMGAKAAAIKKPQVVAAPANTSATIAHVAPPTPAAPKPAAAAGGGQNVFSPLPGTVLSIKVNVGDTVAAGQTLVVLEAMKMENNIDAINGGVVKSIAVQAGATVSEGDVLLVIE